MVIKRASSNDVVLDVHQPALKRRRSGGRSLGQIDIPDHLNALKLNGNATDAEHVCCSPDDNKDKSIGIASATKYANQTIAPFLTRHIPEQYAPLGGPAGNQKKPSKDPNSRFCYRHRPDLLCRRQADEPSMDQLQRVR